MNNINLVQGLPGNPPNIPKLFDVPQGMEQYMRPISGLLMHNLQNRALAGNGNHATAFWLQCVQNNFNNPYFREAMLHTASLAFARWQQNNSVVNNPEAWLSAEVDRVAVTYPIYWAQQQMPQMFATLDVNTQNQVRVSLAEYSQMIQGALQLFQNGTNMNAAMMMGMNGFNNGMMGQGGFGGFGGNPGMNQQQMAQLLAQQQQNGWMNGQQGFGQQNTWFGNGQQGGFNPNAWNQQQNNNMMGNQSYNGQGGANWSFNNGVNNDNILTAGKVGGFEPADQGNGKVMSTQEQFDAMWNTGGAQQNNQQQQTQNVDVNNGWGANNNVSSFNTVNTSGQSTLDAMMGAQASEINAAAAVAPLQTFGPQETGQNNGAMQTPVITPVTKVADKTILINPKNLPVKIQMVNGSVQRHLKFFNPTTQYSVCEVENGKIVKQEIRTKEAETMEFNDQNTAAFLKPKGNEASKVGLKDDDGLTLAEVAERALHYAYLDSAIKQINEESTAETLESEDIAKGLARISEDKIIRLDDMIDAPFNTPSVHVQHRFSSRGVDAVFNKSVIVADIIQMDNSSLSEELADRIDEIRTGDNTVSKLVYGFNRLRPHLGENNWSRLNREITIWLNEELFTKYGLSLSIDDFAAHFEELVEHLQGDQNGFSWEEIQELTGNIALKFLNVYRHDHPSAVNIYTEENGYSEDNDYNLLGIIQRYVFLPLYSKDLTITTNSTSGIVTPTNQPELYAIISSSLSNLNAGNDVIARNFLVTLNGDQILVTRPHGMRQFILTRMENGMIKNPLL